MKKTIQTIVMAALCLNLSSNAQEPIKPPALKNQGVIGKVISAFTGESLPGAVIKVNAPSHTTVSSDKGEFILTLSNGTYNISISHLNYKTKSINIQIPLKEPLVIALDNDDKNLQEVEINAGYYTVKDKERIGAISRVTAETIGKQPVSNPLAALIGRMPGVNIEQQSGINGGGFKVEIRGRNSLRADGREPLFLVDGVPYPSTQISYSGLAVTTLAGASPLNYLNPADIASIEVLKDADATAIYGSRGANGVILIKTKSAKVGRTSIDLNIYKGLSKVGSKLDFLNTEQYLEMRNEAFKNDGVAPGTTDYDVNGAWDKTRYTDWQKEIIGRAAYSTNIQSAINGGNEFTQISFRANYNKQTTVFPGDFANTMGTGALNVNHTSVNKKLKANFTSFYSVDFNNLPQLDLTQYITLAPNAPALYDAKGQLNWAQNSTGNSTWTNPMAATRQQYLGKTNTLNFSGALSYELISDLVLRSNFGYNSLKIRESVIYPISAKNPASGPTGSNTISHNTIENWIVEPQLDYKKEIGHGVLSVLAGATMQKNDQKQEALFGSSYTSDLLIKSINAAPVKGAASSSSQYNYAALFGRINYNYKSKYIINLTGRRDGSSRFGPGKQFANFGAAGLAWIFFEEAFIRKKLPFISFGKLRGSFGVTGSDQIPNYGYLDTYQATDPYLDGTGLIVSRLANPDYSWESTEKLDLAIDLGLFNDRIMLSANFYRNRSSNQLVGYTLPDITGFSSIQYNLDATVQNTGLEIELNTTNLTIQQFTWKTSANLTIPKNKLLKYPNIKGSTNANNYAIGASMYTPIALHYIGVNPVTGLYTFEDLNGNGTDTETADRKVAPKSLTSHWYGGIQNTLNYKNFQLDVFFQFMAKTARRQLNLVTPGSIGNQLTEVLKRWQKTGDDTDIQKYSQSTTTGGAVLRFGSTGSSDRFIDASFFRLKNASLSWNAPQSWVKKVKLNTLKIYTQGQNLFTLTKYPGDPEILNVKTMPLLTTVTIGVQIGI